MGVDPVTKYHENPYNYAADNPVMFIDVNGEDTAKVANTINDAKYKGAWIEVMKSEEFQSFFQSFVDGENSDIMLEFQSVPNLTGVQSTNPKNFTMAETVLMYKNKPVVNNVGSIPSNAKMSDFKVVLKLNPNYDWGNPSGDYQRAQKGVTLVHEMFIHLSKIAELQNNAMEGDKLNSKTFVNSYMDRWNASEAGADHDELYSDELRPEGYKRVSNQIINIMQNNVKSNFQIPSGFEMPGQTPRKDGFLSPYQLWWYIV